MKSMREWFAALMREVREECEGKSWPLRFLMWCWFVSMLLQYLKDPMYTGWIGGLNLGIHEFGHLICSPLGKFVGVAGGSLVQCLVPLISVYMFWRQGDYFAWSFSLVWLATNLFGVAIYIADARALKLELVSPFGGGDGEVIHDWNWLLHEMKCLQWNLEIAQVVRGCAWLAMIGGILWGAWTLWLMMRSKPKEIGSDWPDSPGKA